MRRLAPAVLPGLVIALGLIVAAAMMGLGLWQMKVYERQGDEATARREALPPLVLAEVAPPSQPVREGYGRTVTFSGRYLADEQLLVPQPDGGFRVLTPMTMADGTIVPVVRGVVDGPDAPPPPAGQVDQVGVLAPTEASSPPAQLPPDQIPGVDLSVLAQRWTGPMIGGYVTLADDAARHQALAPARPVLPHQDGRARNAAYALQWWVFAAFAIAMAIKIAKDLRTRRLFDEESARREHQATTPEDTPEVEASTHVRAGLEP